MPATQQDIANKVKLSRSTVAKVLNNRPDVWVSEENRKRILLTAEQMNYRPNAAARALRCGKSYTVALVFIRQPGLGTTGVGQPTEILAEYLGGLGYSLLIHAFNDQEHLLEKLGDLAATRACDAVVLWGEEGDVQAQGRLLDELEIPFVVKGRFENSQPQWPQVDYNHEAMAATALEYLVQRGHRNILYIGHDNQQAYAVNLRGGFNDAHVRLLGAPPRHDFVVLSVDTLTRRVTLDEMVTQWLSLPTDSQPTAAVIGVTGGAWLELESALYAHGRRIGFDQGDFAVAGIGYIGDRLIFGQAVAFQHVGLGDLAFAMTQNLLPAVLEGRLPDEPIQRVLPPLAPYHGPWVSAKSHQSVGRDQSSVG